MHDPTGTRRYREASPSSVMVQSDRIFGKACGRQVVAQIKEYDSTSVRALMRRQNLDEILAMLRAAVPNVEIGFPALREDDFTIVMDPPAVAPPQETPVVEPIPGGDEGYAELEHHSAGYPALKIVAAELTAVAPMTPAECRKMAAVLIAAAMMYEPGGALYTGDDD